MIDPVAILRLKSAWSHLTPDQKARFQGSMDLAEAATQEVLATNVPPKVSGIRHEMMLANSVLKDDVATLAKQSELAIRQALFGLKPYIDSNGDIWGFGKWQQLDAGWLEALAALWENIVAQNFFPFGAAAPAFVSYPQDTLKVALVADWGTGEWGSNGAQCPSEKIIGHIQEHAPDVVIHLGDVYYAGSAAQEVANMVDLWKGGTLGSFTLNSNHEMYPGGVPYFQKVLGSDAFAAQGQRSFFGIETNTHIILGLDSAFYSDPFGLYMHGALWNGGPADASPQFQLIRAAAAKGKPILVLTHHNPICEDGSADPDTPLESQLEAAFAGTGVLPQYWYYGHIHIGAVYDQPPGGNEAIRYRCIGHGGLPWGYSSALEAAACVPWFEKTPVAGSSDNRVMNGFAVLELSADGVKETIYNEDGVESWPTPGGE